MDPAHAAALVVAHAKALGFHRVGIVPVQQPATMPAYESWLAAGYAGSMDYLSSPDHIVPRRDPTAVLAHAKTMIVVALAYDPSPRPQRRLTVLHPTSQSPSFVGDFPPSAKPSPLNSTSSAAQPPNSPLGASLARGPAVRLPDDRLRGNIARYAAGEDYHIVMRDRLYALSRYIHEHLGAEVMCRPCVDSAPVLERDAAARAGIGFVAKNTMVIAPGLGSYFVLGELLLDIEIQAQSAAPVRAGTSTTHCGKCVSCIDACPTGAFVDAYLLDSRKCISYLTIEHRGNIDRVLRPKMGLWIFGCDICQQVCPYNAGTGESSPAPLPQRDVEHVLPDLVRLVTFGSNQLRHFVKRTAMRRAPREQILRNVAIALGNSGDVRGWQPLLQLLAHRHAMVRSHAAWGLGRLAQMIHNEPRQPHLHQLHLEEVTNAMHTVNQLLQTELDHECTIDLHFAKQQLAAVAASLTSGDRRFE